MLIQEDFYKFINKKQEKVKIIDYCIWMDSDTINLDTEIHLTFSGMEIEEQGMLELITAFLKKKVQAFQSINIRNVVVCVCNEN